MTASYLECKVWQSDIQNNPYGDISKYIVIVLFWTFQPVASFYCISSSGMTNKNRVGCMLYLLVIPEQDNQHCSQWFLLDVTKLRLCDGYPHTSPSFGVIYVPLLKWSCIKDFFLKEYSDSLLLIWKCVNCTAGNIILSHWMEWTKA